MSRESQKRLADLLVAARRSCHQIRHLDPELIPCSHEEGYKANALVAQGLGWAPLGWKIAGTNSTMQQRLRSDGVPIYGRSYRMFETLSPARFRHRDLLDPLVECEFFFRLKDPLLPRGMPYNAEEVMRAVATVHAGIEIAECRFPRTALPPMPAILADGAASGRYIVGREIEDRRCRDLAAVSVVLEVNGVVRRTGSGEEVMGNPIAPLVWLANERSRWGDGLAAGALVSTGTATGMLLAKPGDQAIAYFDGTPAVEVAFDV